MKIFRLLPAVMALSAALLVLKGTGLVHEASAQSAADAAVPSAAPAQSAADAADDDVPSASAAEVDVLSSLAKRRAELDARTRDLDMRDNLLAATEKRVDDKIALLKQLQTQIATLLGQRDAEADKQIASLVKTYSSMKPKDAARIFEGLNDEVLIPVAQKMKSDALAPVLAAMSPGAAQKLTVKLASRLDLPKTDAAAQTPAAPPPALPQTVAQATAPAPAPTSAATPAAQQTQAPAPQPAQPAAPQPAPEKHG